MGNNNYQSVYRNTGMTPRKMASHSDAYAIERGRTEWQDAKDFFVGAFLVMTIIGIGASIAVGVLSWLGVAIFQ